MFSSIVIGLLSLLVRATIQNRKDKRKIEYLESQSHLNQLMRDCIRHTRISRFLILKLTNGANEVLNGERKRYYATALNEEFADISKSVLKLYQGVPVDDAYKQMIEDTHKLEYYDFITANEPQGDLKRIYEAEGIVQSRVFFVHEFSGTVYYCTVASYEPYEMTESEARLIMTAIKEIRESYRAFYN